MINPESNQAYIPHHQAPLLVPVTRQVIWKRTYNIEGRANKNIRATTINFLPNPIFSLLNTTIRATASREAIIAIAAYLDCILPIKTSSKAIYNISKKWKENNIKDIIIKNDSKCIIK